MHSGPRAESSTRLPSGSFQGQPMNLDYYSLLRKAVAGQHPAARDRIYKDAWGIIRRSQLTGEEASARAAALKHAIRQIEDELAAKEARSAAEINALLS